MADRLPPDLALLGDHITAAAERNLQARRRRVDRLGWLVSGPIVAVLAVAMLAPGALGPAQQAGDLLRFDRPSGGARHDQALQASLRCRVTPRGGCRAAGQTRARMEAPNTPRRRAGPRSSRPGFAGDQRAAFNLRVGTHR